MTCSRVRCKRRASVAGICATHAVQTADKKFSLLVRGRSRCELARYIPSFDCAGMHQTAHLISRRYRATRWDPRNAVCSCAAHHRWLDTNPLQRQDIIERILSPGGFRSLRETALAGEWRPVLEAFLEAA